MPAIQQFAKLGKMPRSEGMTVIRAQANEECSTRMLPGQKLKEDFYHALALHAQLGALLQLNAGA